MRGRSKLLGALLVACRVALLGLAAQNAAVTPAKKALFWKATSDSTITYLLGSIHLGSKDMYPLPKEVEDAFESSTALVVEVDINHLDRQKMHSLAMEKALYAGDDVLWNHVSAETRKRVEQFCEKYGIPTAGLAELKPWAVAIAAPVILMMKNGMDPHLGMDKYFLEKAGKAQDKKRVVEIESAEWQIKLLSGFSDELQEQCLAAVMEQADKMQDTVKRIQELWLSGDAEGLDRLTGETLRGPEQVTRALLQDRNPHMADVVERFLRGKEQAFVVVGAAHLVGKDGVVRILEKRGYKVEQVTAGK
jgi:uncharacterized protein YbaP (TraB family)